MLDLWERRRETIGAAHEAGVPIYAGTDAGGVLAHGLIASEVIELTSYGLSAFEALGAASWRAREWLGCSGTLEEGTEADFVVYDLDPLEDLAILKSPRYTVLRGRWSADLVPLPGPGGGTRRSIGARGGPSGRMTG